MDWIEFPFLISDFTNTVAEKQNIANNKLKSMESMFRRWTFIYLALCLPQSFAGCDDTCHFTKIIPNGRSTLFHDILKTQASSVKVGHGATCFFPVEDGIALCRSFTSEVVLLASTVAAHQRDSQWRQSQIILEMGREEGIQLNSFVLLGVQIIFAWQGGRTITELTAQLAALHFENMLICGSFAFSVELSLSQGWVRISKLSQSADGQPHWDGYQSWVIWICTWAASLSWIFCTFSGGLVEFRLDASEFTETNIWGVFTVVPIRSSLFVVFWSPGDDQYTCTIHTKNMNLDTILWLDEQQRHWFGEKRSQTTDTSSSTSIRF